MADAWTSSDWTDTCLFHQKPGLFWVLKGRIDNKILEKDCNSVASLLLARRCFHIILQLSYALSNYVTKNLNVQGVYVPGGICPRW